MLAGGYREAAASVRGDDVYGSLKHENGVHRVSNESVRGGSDSSLPYRAFSVFSSDQSGRKTVGSLFKTWWDCIDTQYLSAGGF